MQPIPSAPKLSPNFGRQVNLQHWQAQGLQYFFSFDERAGRTAFNRGSVNADATLNWVTWNADSVGLKTVGSSFAPNLPRASLPPFTLPNAHTVHIDLKWDGAAYGYVLGGYDATHTGYPLFYGDHCRLWTGGGNINFPLALATGERLTLTIVRGPTRVFLYKNGEHVASEWNVGTPNISEIGARNDGNDSIEATFYGLRIYDRAFTPEQVRELHRNPDDIWLSGFSFVLAQTGAPAPDAPVITSPTNGTLTTDTTPTFVGTSEPDMEISVYSSASLLGTTTADGSGNWTFTPVMVMAEGAHVITATATNEAEVESEPSNTVNLTIDSVAPSPPVITAPTTGTVTNDNTVLVSGTSEADAFVTIFDGATELGSVLANGGGVWTYTTGALADGSHSFTATATDEADNESDASSPAVTITIDTVAPNAPVITSPSTGTSTSDTTPTFVGTAEANASISVYRAGATLLGTTTANGAGAWTFTPGTPLTEGTHSITARATDSAGNQSSASSAISITIDTLAPDAPEITSPLDGATTADSTPTIQGTAEASATVRIYRDSALVGTTTANGAGAWSYTSSNLANGIYEFTATALDSAGNVSAESETVSLTVAVVDVEPIERPRNDTIREFVVGAIQGIATTFLDMDSDDSIHDYLLENEVHSKRSSYLKAVVNGQRVTRAVGVRVLSEDVPYASGNIYRRTFTIRVELYYPGDPGGYNLMVDHSVLIREALEADQTLGGQVDLYTGFTNFVSTQESFGVDNKEGKINVGVLELVASTRKIQIQ